MDHDKRAEKSWNDPPMFSIDQLNKAASSVPVNKRYRYPQQAAQPAPAQNQMYQQNSYNNYPGQQQQMQPNAGTFPPSYGQQPQQSYPTSYSPYSVDPNSAQQISSNYSNPSPIQQYSQFPPGQTAMNPTPYASGGYANSPNQQAMNPNQQVNQFGGGNQYAGNPASQYNSASQYAGQPPPTMQPNYQSQPYNPQARY